MNRGIYDLLVGALGSEDEARRWLAVYEDLSEHIILGFNERCKARIRLEKTNAEGREFLARVRAIIDECSRLGSPARAARVAAFSICVMLDGSGEACGTQYRMLTEDGDPVKFFHHDL